jgi:uncharacterized protein YigA (DUF484 family)
MSTQRKPDFVEQEPAEQAVHDYLAAHPEFFERHGALLSLLQVPHTTGTAVSLVERQVSVLRQKEVKLQRQLKDLISVARTNDILAAKIHELSLQLFATDDLPATIATVEEAMRSGFGADQAVLVLFGDPTLFADINVGRFFRVVEYDNPELKTFATFLKANTPRCGQIRDAQRDFLFQTDADDIGSVALVPLGKKSEIGFLAIGSADGDRFHPGMSIDFLTRVGDLVTGSLKKY